MRMIQTQIFEEKKFDIDVLVVEELHKPVSSLILGHNCGPAVMHALLHVLHTVLIELRVLQAVESEPL